MSPERLKQLRFIGWERALAYRTLALTGLRRNELASITVARAVLETGRPHLALAAADEKGRRGARIELRADVAEDLREWLQARLARERAEAVAQGRIPSLRLDPDSPLLSVPTIRVFDADIEHAAIEKRDDRGRTDDIHALRHTFVSHTVPWRRAVAHGAGRRIDDDTDRECVQHPSRRGRGADFRPVNR